MARPGSAGSAAGTDASESREGGGCLIRVRDGFLWGIVAILIAAAIFFLSLLVFNTDAANAKPKKVVARFAWQHCGNDHPRLCVRAAARKHGIPAGPFKRLIACESGFDPKAKGYAPVPGAGGNGYANGLAQFIWNTWVGYVPDRYREHKNAYWTARWQAMGAAWMIRRGMASHWVCPFA